jgi:hypothetical protein
MTTAMQCIPEFHGKSEKLVAFCIQIDYFAAVWGMVPKQRLIIKNYPKIYRQATEANP